MVAPKLREILDKAKSRDLARIHHNLMQYYQCWIPVEEFRKIPIPTLIDLLEYIDQDLSKIPPSKIGGRRLYGRNK
ncbi:MAG: hypothetical protein DRH37_06635 [Deltaproteobacteria bacterium]|nr:MAG: hypothetical protein DRH37_06635 [Deltaproteobacteria bacterium]